LGQCHRLLAYIWYICWCILVDIASCFVGVSCCWRQGRSLSSAPGSNLTISCTNLFPILHSLHLYFSFPPTFFVAYFFPFLFSQKCPGTESRGCYEHFNTFWALKMHLMATFCSPTCDTNLCDLICKKIPLQFKSFYCLCQTFSRITLFSPIGVVDAPGWSN